MAKEGFISPKGRAETYLLKQARNGQCADFTERKGREIRAEFLAALLMGRVEGLEQPHPKGIWLNNAIVEDELDLRDAAHAQGDRLTALPPFRFEGEKAELRGGINLSHARIARLSLHHAKCLHLRAIGAFFGGLLDLENCQIDRIDLHTAEIDGNFVAHELKPWQKSNKFEIRAQNLSLRGHCWLENAGTLDNPLAISFISARIGGNLNADGAILAETILQGATIEGSFTLRTVDVKKPFIATDKFDLSRAYIKGSLECGGGRFEKGLIAQMLKVEGNVLLRGIPNLPFVAIGMVSLMGSKIGRDLECNGGWFLNVFGNCLILDGVEIGGRLLFSIAANIRIPAISLGNMWLERLHVHGDIVLTGSILRRDEGNRSLSLSGARIDGALISQGFAQLPGDEKPQNAEFKGRIEGLRDLVIATAIADIENDEERQMAETIGTGVYNRAFGLSGEANPNDEFAHLPDGKFDLSNARVGTLKDDPLLGWPGPEGLMDLTGFEFDRIDLHTSDGHGHYTSGEDRGTLEHSRAHRKLENKAQVSQRRLAWLRHQYVGGKPEPKDFSPQPFEHLAQVLRRLGHDHDANRVSADKHRFRRECRVDSWPSRLGSRILEYSCGHGYSPLNVLRSLGGAVLVSWLLAIGAGLGDTPLIAPQFDPTENASFQNAFEFDDCVKRSSGNGLTCYGYSPFLYALDEFVPVVDLEQAAKFDLRPDALPLFKIIQMLVQIAGWFLISAAVVTFTGVLRKD